MCLSLMTQIAQQPTGLHESIFLAGLTLLLFGLYAASNRLLSLVSQHTGPRATMLTGCVIMAPDVLLRRDRRLPLAGAAHDGPRRSRHRHHLALPGLIAAARSPIARPAWTRIKPLIETAAGIARAVPLWAVERVARSAFGSVDLAAQLGIDHHRHGPAGAAAGGPSAVPVLMCSQARIGDAGTRISAHSGRRFKVGEYVLPA
jgi:hypothetical protein